MDIVIDSDAYNEVDDQFAIAYALRSRDRLNVKAIYAAPFFNDHSKSPLDGMEQSYNEILTLLELTGDSVPVFRGSGEFLSDESTPVFSDAARDLVARALTYSPAKPLYVLAIGAITNVASALLINPRIADNIVVVWLGGHAHHYHHNREFNLKQDIAAARVVMQSGAPFIQLPCHGVVDAFTVSRLELLNLIKGKNALCDHLADYTIAQITEERGSEVWTKVIWDAVAVAWFFNDDGTLMHSRVINAILPSYDGLYEEKPIDTQIGYVFAIRRDAIFNDMLEKLTNVD